jgi:hypothetical protein
VSARLDLSQPVIGYLLAQKGEALRSLKEVTNCNVHIDDMYDEHGLERQMRTARISAREGVRSGREAAVALCERALRIVCEEECEVNAAVSKAMQEVEEDEEMRKQMEETEKAAKIEEHECETVARVVACVGDMFDREAIREALVKENWSIDSTCDRLYNERDTDVNKRSAKPALNMQRLLAAAREANSKKADASKKSQLSPRTVHDEEPSKAVIMIRDIFAKIER